MQFGRVWQDGGYVVKVLCDFGDGLRWHPLRNFGDRQGDSIEFLSWDCPELSEAQLKMLAKNYNPDIKYIRVSSKHFKVQR